MINIQFTETDGNKDIKPHRLRIPEPLCPRVRAGAPQTPRTRVSIFVYSKNITKDKRSGATSECYTIQGK